MCHYRNSKIIMTNPISIFHILKKNQNIRYKYYMLLIKTRKFRLFKLHRRTNIDQILNKTNFPQIQSLGYLIKQSLDVRTSDS